MSLATAVEKSGNAKTGPVSVTYASQSSCPKTCPLLNNGCYAELGYVRLVTNRLNKQPATPIDVAKAEAEALNKLSGTRPLRCHVVGDCSTDETAKIVSEAAKRFPVAWSYTHAWRTVKRSSWNNVSILASVEKLSDAKLAHKRKYPSAIIVNKFKSMKAWVEDGFRIIPCPAQTKDINCTQCKLCWKSDWLHQSKSVIAFEAHGSKKNTVKELVQINL